jgi:hypothetical protein
MRWRGKDEEGRMKGRWKGNKIKIMKKMEEKIIRREKKNTVMNKIFPDALRPNLLA